MLGLKYVDKTYQLVIAAYPHLAPDSKLLRSLGWSQSAGVIRMIANERFLPSSASQELTRKLEKAKTIYYSFSLAFVVFIVGMWNT